jgi:hypothetical protein
MDPIIEKLINGAPGEVIFWSFVLFVCAIGYFYNKINNRLDNTMSEPDIKHYVNTKIINLDEKTKAQVQLLKQDVDNGFALLGNKIDNIAEQFKSIVKISVKP